MKKVIDAIKKYPFILIFLLILVVFTPYSLFSPGESRKRAVVIAIGLDKIENEYEISFLTFIPSPNQEFQQSNSVVSGKGSSVSEAVLDAQLTLGKDIGLSHAKTTVVNERMLEGDVSSSLDYLMRVVSLPENTVFVCTNTTAKELLMATDSLEQNLGLKLDQLVSYNANEVYITDTSLEAFYKGYYSPTKSSLIGYIEHVKEDNSQGQEEAQNGSQGSGDSQKSSQTSSSQDGQQGMSDSSEQNSSAVSSGQSENEKQRGSLQGQSQILNKGDAVLLRDGQKVALLDVDNLNSINLLSNKRSLDSITITDVETEDGKKVDMTFMVKNKIVSVKTDFQNNIPLFVANINLGVQLSEIDTKAQKVKQNVQNTQITEEIAQKLEQKIKAEFAKVLQILRENKADVIGVYDSFFTHNRKEFLKFLSSLDDSESFLNDVVFMLNLKIQQDG